MTAGRPRRIAARGTLVLCAALAAAIGSPRTGLAQAWVDQRVFGPLVCRAEFPLDGLEGLLRDLAQIQADLTRCLGLPPAREPIEVYLFRDKRTYDAYLARSLPQVPYRRALYVKSAGPGRVFAYRSRQFETDVRHECTHALLHAVLPMVPLWLDEGLAEYFEVPANQRAFDNPHLSTVRWNARLGMMQSLEPLEKKSSLSQLGEADYRSCWAWVHFMLHGPRAAHEELVKYLADIRAGTPPGLLSNRLDRRFPSTKGQMAAHFKGWQR